MGLLGPPTSKQRERWERLKRQGKRRFILRVGVCQWGGFMFVVMTAESLLRKPSFPRHFIDYLVEILLGLAIWPAAGYLFGLSLWTFYSNRFSDDSNADR